MERYQHIVRMNLFGHFHTDEFRVMSSFSNPNRPVGTLTACGSITTWGKLNPSFCVYEVDKETMLIVNRKTYAFDLNKANEEGEIEWDIEIDWQVEY